MNPPPLLARLHSVEPWLVLLAGPPLVLWEAFPHWVGLAALAWLGALWVVRWQATGRWTIRTPVDGPVIALLVILPVAVWAAGAWGPAGTAAALSRTASLVFAMALCYSLANAIKTPRRAWSATLWLLVAGLVLVVVGMVSTGWLEKYPALTPLFPRLISQVPHPTLETGVHPNQLAAVLLPFILLGLSLLLPSPAAGEEESSAPDLRPPRSVRVLAAVTVTATTVLVLLTQSRGAWLALALTLGLWLILRFPHVVHYVVPVGFLLAVVVGVALAWGQGSSGPARDGSVKLAEVLPGASRLGIWREGLQMFSSSPATGIGLNTFVLAHGRRPEYQGGFIYQGLAHAHNTLLQAGLDFGMAGLVAVVGLYSAVAWTANRAFRRLASTAMGPLVLGLALGLLAVAIHGMVDALAIGAKPGLVVWAFIGILVGLRANAHRWSSLPDKPRPKEEVEIQYLEQPLRVN